MKPTPEVRILPAVDAAVPLLLAEVRQAMAQQPVPLIGFATGGTFTVFLRALGTEILQGRLSAAEFVATHPDEYLGFEPDRRGGMVHELTMRCAPFRDMLARGTFLPVPAYGAVGSMQGHESRMQRAGGLVLQFLGIGRNGHVAFHEPGVPLETGFHVATLSETTRTDAVSRFAPDPPPEKAVTAGVATLLAAKRIVLCAFGKAKADAVRAMLHGDVSPACPASGLRRHGNLLVLLDRDAASALDGGAAADG